MARGEVLQCFLNADLRNGHDGLAGLAKSHDLNVNKLLPGQYVVFINSGRDRIKVYAASNVIAYLKMPKGQRVEMTSIQYIPRAFNGSGRIDYDSALKQAVMDGLKRKGKPNALEVYQEMRRKGVA